MKWLVVIVSIVVVGTALVGCYIYDKSMIDAVLLFATFIAVLIYTLKTSEMSEATKEMVRQSVKQFELQAQIYLDSKTPVISFLMVNREPGKAPEYWVPFKLVNFSDYDTSVWVNLNVKIDGVLVEERGPDYTGERPWNLQARETIHAPGFKLQNVVKSVDKTVESLQKDANEQRQTSRVSLDIDIRYSASGDRVINKPIKHYYFDFGRMLWVYRTTEGDR